MAGTRVTPLRVVADDKVWPTAAAVLPAPPVLLMLAACT